MFKKILLSAALATAAMSAAAAPVLYGSDGFTGAIVSIDTTTAVATQVASIAGSGVGMAWNPNTSTLYARNFGSLFTVDPVGGTSTLVGASGSFLTGLAFNAAFSTLYSIDQGNGGFYAVDPTTGTPTLIGASGLSSPLSLTSNPGGVVYATDISGNLSTIDTSTGLATIVSTGITYTGIAFDSSGVLWGVSINGDNLTRDLLGTPVIVGSVAGWQDIRGMVFAGPSSQVPEPGALALLLAVGVPLLLVRRRRV